MNYRVGRAALALAALFCLIPAVAVGDYWYGDFTGDSTWTADAAVLFAAPSDTAETVANLPTGTLLRILESDSSGYRHAGYDSYWYRAQAPGGETGWIPGAFLALSGLPLGGDTLFLFAITALEPDPLKDHSDFMGIARILAGSEVLSEIPGNAPGGDCGSTFYPYNTECYTLDPSGLEGIRDLINLSFIYNECGYQSPDQLFAWTGSELVVGPQGPNEFEAGIYVLHSRFGLPSNGGEPGVVTVETSLSQWDEAVEDYIESETVSFKYVWDGASFTLENDLD